ncbi:putative RNA-directed DNA polymerase [Helianthus annuus]|nr:putative RNA-directed DNA polymerase [Helianthus annuus]
MPIRPKLVGYQLNRLSEVDSAFLVSQFSEEEIKRAVFACGDDKAPGPDGFNFKFIKRYWNLFAQDFVKLVDYFSEHGIINKGAGSSFITLIPKVKDPSGLGDYRPINLIGVISKVISKLLANRLRTVINSLISDSQSAFISGRYILDGPLIINEILSWSRVMGKSLFLFKIDFEKAYDNVNWEFLISVMRQMGFPEKWSKWIYGILASARSSVLVNGSPTFEFACTKGIRQGDPLSPFLFVIVMEAFSSLFRKATDIGIIEGIRLPNGGPHLTHLLYADDAMVMGEWSDNNFKSVMRILRVFYLCSGLKINIHKSSIFGCGVNLHSVKEQVCLMKCKYGVIPFTYLGVKVGANMNRISNWEPVKEVLCSRLSKWKSKMLSIGGRVTLIKSVLESLPTYYFSIYKAPVKVINELEVIIKKFLWGGNLEARKLHWVAWDKVTCSKKNGGLGLKKLDTSNSALLLKWVWRYRVEACALWRKIIDSIHYTKRKWGAMPINSRLTGTWKNLVKHGYNTKVEGRNMNEMLKGKLGDGKNIRFWIDIWIGEEALKDTLPNLFKLEKNKLVTVVERCASTLDGSSFWSRVNDSRNVAVRDEKDACMGIMNNIIFTEAPDSWTWLVDESGVFSVKSTKHWLQQEVQHRPAFVLEWCKWIPAKVNIFVWRAEMDRIATASALERRNIQVPKKNCVFCDHTLETAEHLFSGCIFATGIWMAIASWCGIPNIFAFSVRDIVAMHLSVGLKGVKKIAFQGIMFISLWSIWKARNDRIFSDKKLKVMEVVAEIKSLSFLWFRCRHKNGCIDWNAWCKFDVM